MFPISRTFIVPKSARADFGCGEEGATAPPHVLRCCHVLHRRRTPPLIASGDLSPPLAGEGTRQSALTSRILRKLCGPCGVPGHDGAHHHFGRRRPAGPGGGAGLQGGGMAGREPGAGQFRRGRCGWYGNHRSRCARRRVRRRRRGRRRRGAPRPQRAVRRVGAHRASIRRDGHRRRAPKRRHAGLSGQSLQLRRRHAGADRRGRADAADLAQGRHPRRRRDAHARSRRSRRADDRAACRRLFWRRRPRLVVRPGRRQGDRRPAA
jgi:hypothetical protein